MTTEIEWVIEAREPYGACWTDLMKAIAWATSELREQGRIKEDQEPYDDMIRLFSRDSDGGEIVVRISKSAVARAERFE